MELAQAVLYQYKLSIVSSLWVMTSSGHQH